MSTVLFPWQRDYKPAKLVSNMSNIEMVHDGLLIDRQDRFVKLTIFYLPEPSELIIIGYRRHIASASLN